MEQKRKRARLRAKHSKNKERKELDAEHSTWEISGVIELDAKPSTRRREKR